MDSVQAVSEMLPDGLVVVDEHQMIRFVNKRAEEILQLARDSLMGHPVREGLLLTDSDGNDWWELTDPWHGLATRKGHREKLLWTENGVEVLITARYIEEYDTPFAGAIITSPWLATAMAIPRWKVLAAGVLNKVLPAMPMDAGVEAEYLSHDPTVVARYKDDPLVHGKITPRLFAEASMAMGLVMLRSERVRIPILFLLFPEPS